MSTTRVISFSLAGVLLWALLVYSAIGRMTVAHTEPRSELPISVGEVSARPAPLPTATKPATTPKPNKTVEELERLALDDAVRTLTDPKLVPQRQRKPFNVSQGKSPCFAWSEIPFFEVPFDYTDRHFPDLSFIQTKCMLTTRWNASAKYAVDRKTGAVRRFEWVDVDGPLQDEAAFLQLVREARIVIHQESDVKSFVNWAQSLMARPTVLRFWCGNSAFESKATQVADDWVFVATADGCLDFSWKISCDANGIVTDVDRNFAKLPLRPTREENRVRRLAEEKRRDEAKAWWPEEEKKADLTALAAKADLIGVARDFTGASGTGGLYHVFTFGEGGILFGDCLNGRPKNSYTVKVQLPVEVDSRFEVEDGERWILFLVARLDQGIHRENDDRNGPAYAPAGEHAILRCTDKLLAEVKRLVAAKPVNAERNAAVRQAVSADSAFEAKRRNYRMSARWAATRVADWSAAPLSAEPNAAERRRHYHDTAVRLLWAAGDKNWQDVVEDDPALLPLRNALR